MLTVRAVVETLASPRAREAVAGGAQALDRLVVAVDALGAAEDLSGVRPNSLVVVPPEVTTGDDLGLELIVRRAAASRISCLVVDAGTAPMPTTTHRLAERFGVAIWREHDLDPVQFRSRAESLVRNPELVGAGSLRRLSEALLEPSRDLAEVIDRAARAMGQPFSLVGPDGRTIAGHRLEFELPDDLGARSTASEVVAEGDGISVVLTPAFPLGVDPSTFWVAATVARGIDPRGSHVLTALRIVSLALSAQLLQASLSYERDNRASEELLNSILRKGDRIPLSVVEEATAFGWQVFGWHTAVTVGAQSSISTVPAAALARSITEALVSHGVTARPVEYEGQVMFWVTQLSEPQPTQLDELRVIVETSLADVEKSFVGARLRAGIGSAREGPSGIAASLDDAKYALAFAQSTRTTAVVQRSDAMTVHRLINALTPSGPAGDIIAELLEPLTRADRDGQLLSTLRTYLDLESNVSETAKSMFVHRNTIIHRLRRIRDALEVDLDDPNGRLAVQLALRLLS